MLRLSRFRRYLLAILLTLLALSVGLIGPRAWGPAATYSFFLAAVMLSSWVGGLGPGIVSTVLGTLAADYFLLAPIHALSFDATHLVHLSAFIATAALISYLNDSRRYAIQALAEERARLEDRVAERTAELAATNATLRVEIDRRRQSERTLGERVKELTALHSTARHLDEHGTPAELLALVVESLPPAWQYPETTAAHISVGTIDVRTSRFEITPWLQHTEFETSAGTRGAIEVVYCEPRPDAVEGPFLAEERSLIESLGGMLRAYFERLEGEEHRVSLARAEAARLQAQEANASKDQFLATLSHELRTPLNVMLGWIQMLRAGPMSAESAARGLEVLERTVRLQALLIDDLLDVSRIVSGKLRIEKRRVDVATVVQLAVDAARPAAEAKHITLTSTIAPLLVLDADPQRLQQVVSNLITNALKFTPEGGSIGVAAERRGTVAQITVRDTGIGMTAELLPRVFDRFQQGDTASAPRHGGLGLGLAIVKYLVEQHGGHVEAASDGHDQGSTFTITLPLEAAAGAPLMASAQGV